MMYSTPKMAVVLTAIICLTLLFNSCSDEISPVQTEAFTYADVTAIEVDYDGQSIQMTQNTTNKISIIEYMNKHQKSAFAKIELSGGVLSVTEGERPIGNGIQSHLEISLPENYQSTLSLHTTDGSISSGAELILDDFYAGTANGKIILSNLNARKVSLENTSGELLLKNIDSESCLIETTNADTEVNRMNGEITYLSKGGDLSIAQASGSGSFQATGDGNMELSFSEINNDLTCLTKNGNITLTLPKNLSFKLAANTKEGKLQTPFSVLQSSDQTIETTIGDSADIQIDLETKNGNIIVE